MAFFNKGKSDKDDAAVDERAARREERRANRKKKKSGDSDEPAGKKSDKAVGANRNRKDESVIREMVFETAVATMKSNKLFRVSRDDEDLYVGILLKFDDIGGLSKKDMKDASKGQIITLINNGNIAALFTGDLKAKDQIVFIPNKNTLEQMSEFSVLADDVEYELVLVNPYDETIENTEVFVNLDYLQKCLDTNQSISGKLVKVLEPTLLPGDDGYNAASETPAVPEQAAASTFSMDETEDESGDSGESGGGDYGDVFDETGESGDEEEEGWGGEGFDDFGGPDDNTGDSGDGEDDGEDGEDAESEEPVYIGVETSAMALSRKFFNDDMARELDTSALEQAIAGIGQFRPLTARPEDSWLSQQLNAMIDMANKELFALHQKNLDTVRNAYLNAIGSAYIDEMSQVEDYKSDPRYSDIAAGIAASSEGLDEIIAEERQKLKAEWEEKVQKEGEVARINAEQAYRNRYQYQYEERLRNIDAEVRAGLQAAENRAIADLKSDRQREAQIRLDQMDSKEIAKAVAAYQALLESESELYAKFETEFLKFLDDNRQAEIARVQVLSVELERDDKIVQIQNEYKAKAEALQADFDARISGLQSDIDTLRVRHQRDLSDKDMAYSELQAKYDADKAEWKAQIKELTDEVIRVNDSKSREVQTRVAEMQAERDSYSQKYDHLVKTQRTSNLMLIALAVVGALAALMVGMFLGGRLGGGAKNPDTLPDTPSAISDVVQPGDDGSSDSNPDGNPDDAQTGSGGGSQGETGQPDVQEPPASDPAWDALQDPVI